MMKTPENEYLRVPQQQVQLHLGKCLLRIQQFELAVRTLIAHHQLSGRASTMADLQAARVEKTSMQTLGTQVRQLLQSYVVAEAQTGPPLGPPVGDEVATFSFILQMQVAPQDHARIRKELGDLVELRNRLVHHFIERYDLWTFEGCQTALSDLQAHCALIDAHIEQFKGWMVDLDEGRRALGEVLGSAELQALVDWRD